MTKATQSVHPMSESLNRRRVLTGAVTAAAVVAGAVISPSANAAPLAARPSELGLAFIAAVREYNAVFEVDLSDDQANAASDRMHAKLEPLRERIAARPVTSLSALVDRAIVAAHGCSDGHDWTNQPGILALVQAVCGLAGVDPSDAMS